MTRLGTGDDTPYTTIYVDDRDWLDLDEQDDAAGLWLYLESNGEAGLQRGGVHPAFTFADPEVPPMVFPPRPPDIPGGPYWPSPIPIFFGGWRLSEGLGLYDACSTGEDGTVWTGTPDMLLF